MTARHRVRIEAGDRAFLTRVFLDDELVRGVVGVHFGVSLGADLRDDEEPLVVLTIAPQAIELDADHPSLHVLEHQRADRPRQLPTPWLRDQRSWRTRLERAWRELTE